MTSPSHDPFLVAAVQAAPVFLDREATVDKACRLIAEAAGGGAKLAVFPECFIPTYPLWVWFIPPANTRALRELYTELLDNAVTIPSDTTERLCAAARDAGIAVTIGMNERNTEASGSTLFNTTLCIGPDGSMLGKHRKIMPTAAERLEIGRISCLTCWENYMPLARYAMWAWGAQIHVAPTWDRGEPWTSTMRHTAKEGRVYVIGCCSALHRDQIPDRLEFKSKFLPPDLEWLNPGGSMIVDPDGKFVVEPVNDEETIIYGEIDPRQLLGPRFQLDVAGHYARPDIFELTVNREERPLIETVDDQYVIEEEIEED
jgi:nitrilase